MQISVSVPNGLVDVSNGKFIGATDLGDGYTRWDWLVHYPINNYDVSLNIGNYVHFSDRLGDLPLDFYVLPEDKPKAEKQFTQAKGMLQVFGHYFGDYPFPEDGYKLIEVPYSGMEHQTAVTYGNHFTNGYLGRDWAGSGISLRFDFIIIHESAHEWFGNSITAADRSDMWIHEGWATYLESLYVESRWGRADALKYLNGLKPKVKNLQPIVSAAGRQQHAAGRPVLQGRALSQYPAQRGRRRPALVGAAARLLPALQVSEHHDRGRGAVLQPGNRNESDADLRSVPAPRGVAGSGIAVESRGGSVRYRWQADEPAFAMPVLVGSKQHWQKIQPTTAWQTMQTLLGERPVRRRDRPLLHQGSMDAVTIELSPIAARVLGSLVEKEITTPEYYPLSLNALVNACNQKNNREPVTNLDEDEIRQALHQTGRRRAGRRRARHGKPRCQV